MVQREVVGAEREMTRDDENKLVARARRGHAESYRAIVEAYKDRLFAFVWRMLRNHHEAEDVCQAVFVRAYESLDSYKPEYALSTWLFTIAYRMTLNVLRRRKHAPRAIDFAAAAGVDGPAASQALAGSEEARRLRGVIWSAVDKLTPAQKSSVLLFYRENKSCQEIGHILDMPPVTVKSHLHRAREKLRGLLRGELVEDWMALEFLSDSHYA